MKHRFGEPENRDFQTVAFVVKVGSMGIISGPSSG